MSDLITVNVKLNEVYIELETNEEVKVVGVSYESGDDHCYATYEYESGDRMNLNSYEFGNRFIKKSEHEAELETQKDNGGVKMDKTIYIEKTTGEPFKLHSVSLTKDGWVSNLESLTDKEKKCRIESDHFEIHFNVYKREETYKYVPLKSSEYQNFYVRPTEGGQVREVGNDDLFIKPLSPDGEVRVTTTATGAGYEPVRAIDFIKLPNHTYRLASPDAEVRVTKRNVNSDILKLIEAGYEFTSFWGDTVDGRSLHVDLNEEIEKINEDIKVATRHINLRVSPSYVGDPIHTILEGEKVTLLGEEMGWAKVKHKDSIGYVGKNFLA